MKCYYELLEVARDADDDTIKKAYRKMALKWHPDKNPDRIEECTQHFALLQQAYETLSDAQERSWYDRHRESILRGGFEREYEDDSINLMPFFARCYTGFGDDDKGFFGVYRKVFDDLTMEDYDYHDDPKQGNYPSFGKADSDYDTVVNEFYGFWAAFSTVRSFAWLDKYDIMSAPNRQTVKAMEKENKKFREAGRRERNEQIRDLVAFIRRRDPRVKKQKEILEARRIESEKRAEEKRKEQIRKNLEQAAAFEESEEAKAAHRKHLEDIENQLAEEFGDDFDSQEEELGDDTPYCIVCEKTFKTWNAKVNHEKSKLHKKQLAELKRHMKEEDAALLHDDDDEGAGSDGVEPAVESTPTGKRTKKQKKKARNKKKEFDAFAVESGDEEEEGGEAKSDEVEELAEKVSAVGLEEGEEGEKGGAVEQEEKEEENLFLSIAKQEEEKKKARRNKDKKKGAGGGEKEKGSGWSDEPIAPKTGKCDKCGEFFESRSKLFAHLKETGHATLLFPDQKGKGGKKGKKK